MPIHDWPAIVRAHARRTGAPMLPAHAIDEIAAHLEDIYLDATAHGQSEAQAMGLVQTALAESSLAIVSPPSTRPAESRPLLEPPPSAGAWSGLFGDARFALR